MAATPNKLNVQIRIHPKKDPELHGFVSGLPRGAASTKLRRLLKRAIAGDQEGLAREAQLRDQLQRLESTVAELASHQRMPSSDATPGGPGPDRQDQTVPAVPPRRLPTKFAKALLADQPRN